MGSFTAALFVTQTRPFDEEFNLLAHALLFEGDDTPFWKIKYADKEYEIIPDRSFILEDCLLIITLLFKKEFLKTKRSSKKIIINDIYKNDELQILRNKNARYLEFFLFHYKLILFPGFSVLDIKKRIKKLKDDSNKAIQIVLIK